MKIYDCFTFYNEFELLELRLETLWDVVDYFVIVEADRTFTNKPKEYNLLNRRNELAKYLSKIRYVRARYDQQFKGVGDWSIEIFQRNLIVRGLPDAAPDDLIFISDLDEIPAPDIFSRIQNDRATVIMPYWHPLNGRGGAVRIMPCPSLYSVEQLLELGPIAMQQHFHVYYLNMFDPQPWAGSILLKYKNMSTPQQIRELRYKLPRIVDGGWHFSYMGGVDRVIQKMTSIVDGNALVVASQGKFVEREHVETVMQNGSDPYEQTVPWKINCRPCRLEDIKLPTLNWFVAKYPHFVRR